MDINYLKLPDFLTPQNDEISSSNIFSVLCNKETIQNLAKHICNKLNHPVTILDLNRIGEIPDSDIRIDSSVEYFSLRNSCKLFRHYAGFDICHECDRYHATMFRNVKKNISKTNLKNIILKKIKNETPISFASSYKDKSPEVLRIYQKMTKTYRLIIEYHCPLLGYRELVFPIFYKDLTIGVLFIGQTIVHENNDINIIKNIKKDFFNNTNNNPKILFKDFIISLYGNLDKDKLIKEANKLKNNILKVDKLSEEIEKYFYPTKKCIEVPLAKMSFTTYNEYLMFIKDACNELCDIENTLTNEADEKLKKYFDNVVNEAVNKYFVDLKDKDDLKKEKYNNEQEYLIKAWDFFFDAKEKIKKDLNLEDAVLFGDGTEIKINGDKKKVYTKNTNDSFYNTWRYDFSIIKNEKPLMYEPLISLNNSYFLKGLNIKPHDTDNIILLIYPDVVLFLKVKSLNKNNEIYLKMAESIGKGFSKIYSDVALRSANFMKERHILTLRLYRHESAHISMRLKDNIGTYFKDKDKKLKYDLLKDERKKRILQDMNNSILLISHMANNIGIITGSIKKNNLKDNYQRLNINDLLYKWQNMFRAQLYGRNLDLQVQINTSNTFIKTHIELFELLFYNLVDNAVKYAHRGSVIRLICENCYKDYKHICFIVSSYGPPLRNEDRPFNLYTRGEYSNDVSGDGIGLYVVKCINNLLELGGVTFNSEIKSVYNIPIISWYLNESFKYDPKYKNKKKELNIDKNLLLGQNILEVINNNDHTKIREKNITPEYLNARIERETWFNVFKVKVPVGIQYSILN